MDDAPPLLEKTFSSKERASDKGPAIKVSKTDRVSIHQSLARPRR